MNTLTWRLLTAEELTRVYLNEMRRDFPPTELKPLSMVLNSEAVGDSHTWGVYDGETLVAYLLMVRPRGATVSQLDYFAVLPACRAAGLGAKLLAALPGKEAGADAILIEAELPEKADDPAMAVRRLGFYARCGAVDTGWTEKLFGASWFRVLTLAAPGQQPMGAEEACRALADENRIRILMALRGRQLCVCQVTAFLDLAPSTTSKHLSILRQARLIESNKQGRWVYYRLADDSPRPNIREALAWMKDSLANDPTIIEDEARIAEILRAEEACGFGHGESDCFHSLEVHSLAQRFENAPQEEENHD